MLNKINKMIKILINKIIIKIIIMNYQMNKIKIFINSILKIKELIVIKDLNHLYFLLWNHLLKNGINYIVNINYCATVNCIFIFS